MGRLGLQEHDYKQVCRHANFLASDTLGHYASVAWGRIVWNYSALTQFVKRQVSFMAGATALLTPNALLKDLPQSKDSQYLQTELLELHQVEVDRMRDVWFCHRRGNPDETIRFIWSKQGGTTLSSTHIRRETPVATSLNV